MKRIVLAAVVGVAGFLGASAPVAGGAGSTACLFPQDVQRVTFSAAKYPNVRQHYLDAVAKGWPAVLVKESVGAAGRRVKLLANVKIVPGQDRDEYPPDVGREGWLADVEYVPSSENRSQGASLGNQLRGLCDGTRFMYVWTGVAGG